MPVYVAYMPVTISWTANVAGACWCHFARLSSSQPAPSFPAAASATPIAPSQDSSRWQRWLELQWRSRRRSTRCGGSRRTMSGTGSSASCPPSDPSSAAPLSSPSSPSSAPLASPPMMPSAASYLDPFSGIKCINLFRDIDSRSWLDAFCTGISRTRRRRGLGRGSMLWIRGSSASAARSQLSPFPRRTPRT